jgi:hypothetical protein
MGTALGMARREVEMMQRYGTANMDNEYSLKVAKEEVALAQDAIKVREGLRELSAVFSFLQDKTAKRMIRSGNLFISIKRVPAAQGPMFDYSTILSNTKPLLKSVAI